MPTILAFVGRYRPGFKSGGILRSVENAVNHLHDQFHFRIVTRDRDVGDEVSYPDLRPHDWQAVGHASVYYLPPEDESLAVLRAIERDTPHDLIRLNSFFDPLTVKVLINRWLGRGGRTPIVVCPFGEFAAAALRQKPLKKVVFMRLARLTGLYRSVTWHAASQVEADDIARAMKVPPAAIRVAPDLPAIYDTSVWQEATAGLEPASSNDDLRVAFFSRIAPGKNLDVALRIIGQVRATVTFDIIGPLDNDAYWTRCQALIRGLPEHVTARALGSITPGEVGHTLGQYDVLLLPTGSESYGHVIEESLMAGTPVLISTHTPWRDLEAKGLGWDLPLNDLGPFVRVLDSLGTTDGQARQERRRCIRQTMRELMVNSPAVAVTRRLYAETLTRTTR